MLNKIKRYLLRRYYIVGICEHTDDIYNSVGDVNAVKWIKYPGYKKNWIADPFILTADKNTITFFAEEWVDKNQKGRLVKLIVNRKKLKVIDKSIILELDTHLSYPIIYREGNDIYVYPENAESGLLNIYKYNVTTDKLENPIAIIKEPLLDTVIRKIDGVYYAFGVKYLTGQQKDTKTLEIYKSNTLLGSYEHFQTIENALCHERGAGDIAVINNTLIRPTQNCEGDYGLNVIFNKLVFDDFQFKETEIGKLLPCSNKPEGLHTYNAYENIAIIDSIAYSCGNVFTIIKKIKRKIYG